MTELLEFLNSLNPELQAELIAQIEIFLSTIKTWFVGIGISGTGIIGYYVRKYFRLKGDNNTTEAKLKATVNVGQEVTQDFIKLHNATQTEVTDMKNAILGLIEINATIIKGMPIDAKTLIETGKTINRVLDASSSIGEKLKNIIEEKQTNQLDIPNYTDTIKG